MYELLAKQTELLISEESWYISVFSNLSALLYETLPDLNWAGFYIVRDGALLIGPFQGKTACIRIAEGKGVCGRAFGRDETVLVPDVHEFEGHIACDSRSRSEIVLPVHHDGRVIAVMDLDSPLKGRFTDEDRQGLEKIVELMEKMISLS